MKEDKKLIDIISVWNRSFREKNFRFKKRKKKEKVGIRIDI